MDLERLNEKEAVSIRAARVYKNSLEYYLCRTVLSKTPFKNKFKLADYDKVRKARFVTLDLDNEEQKSFFDSEVDRMKVELESAPSLYSSRIFSSSTLITEKLNEIYDELHR